MSVPHHVSSHPASLRLLAHPVLLAALLIAAVLGPTRSERTNACFWDSDTLRQEASGQLHVIAAITGRFDRFPPSYYQHRLDRIRAIPEHERTLADFDDAAVACDRLGRSDEGIAWMARKLETLEHSDAAGEDTGDHRYRYLANLGTIHAHRWIRRGAPRDDLADLAKARELIAGAIEINPDAHFGRERYQLWAIEWLISPPESESNGHPPLLFHYTDENGRIGDRTSGFTSEEREHAINGLVGLVTLGDAWESLDIFEQLARLLWREWHSSMALAANLRVRELIDNGAVSLHPDYQSSRTLQLANEGPVRSSSLRDTHGIPRWYERARSEADGWRKARNAYIEERVALGRHPDTHPDFWDAWKSPSSAPALPNGWLGFTGFGKAVVAFGVVFGLLVANSIRRRIGRRVRAKTKLA